ncbi:TetR/AcrR family transcriptional regulator [Aliiroseovarius sp. KMU-50]|uniref:TetR/AcrR family transcriptional regulator n=1 Tax=Aliiroseovarius salicola TaxID=3009082 RepID=A0ABT4VYB4_9RHOB|nr:TetR/AcrR family transcriptional regulator [Aliiroseovarius sp. KMU-50]MDA5093201.1 TetR/AcrR family transcriptional regulator [Aliiroseovarius sp. KMU-50]
MTGTRTRLNGEDWVEAGFRALISSGPKALKAEPLAREMGTTKGSFYWHFKDIPDFHSKMLSSWENHAKNTISEGLAAEKDPVRRLYLLGEIAMASDVTQDGNSAEPAIRAWAQENQGVAEAVGRIDQSRLAHLEQALSDLELTNPEFARLIYGACIGLGSLPSNGNAENRDAMSTLMAALLALRDA